MDAILQTNSFHLQGKEHCVAVKWLEMSLQFLYLSSIEDRILTNTLKKISCAITQLRSNDKLLEQLCAKLLNGLLRWLLKFVGLDAGSKIPWTADALHGLRRVCKCLGQKIWPLACKENLYACTIIIKPSCCWRVCVCVNFLLPSWSCYHLSQQSILISNLYLYFVLFFSHLSISLKIY